jgi:hypothetical protein
VFDEGETEGAMNQDTVKNVIQRLECMEREHLRVKRGAGVILATIAAAVLMGQAMPPKVPTVVEAEQFVLRDRHGKARAWLNMSNGAVNFALADKNEKSRTLLYVLDDGTNGLILGTQNGETRVEMKVGTDGVPTLSLIDNAGNRIGMFVLSDGKPVLGVVDRTQRLRGAMRLEKDGRVRLVLSDENATERAELTVLPDGTPRLSLIGHTGRLNWHGP